MAEVNFYVDTDVSGGLGDGSSWANAYSSLSAFNSAEATDLVTATDNYVVHCRASSGTADTTSITWSGWTTNATYDLKIIVDSADRQAGKWDATKYRFEHTNAAGMTFSATLNLEFEGVQFYMNGTNNNNQGSWRFTNNAPVIKAHECIFKGNQGSGLYNDAIQIYGAGASTANITLWNCVFHGYTGGTSAAVYQYDTNSTVTLYNCTAINNTIGFACSAGTMNAYDCYAGGNTTDYSGTFNTKTTCASSDTTGSSGLQNIACSISSGAYFTNVTAGSEDLHIGSSSSLKDAGTGSGSGTFSDDIDGDTRSSWDIGVDEYVAAGAGLPLPVGMDHYLRMMGA